MLTFTATTIANLTTVLGAAGGTSNLSLTTRQSNGKLLITGQSLLKIVEITTAGVVTGNTWAGAIIGQDINSLHCYSGDLILTGTESGYVESGSLTDLSETAAAQMVGIDCYGVQDVGEFVFALDGHGIVSKHNFSAINDQFGAPTPLDSFTLPDTFGHEPYANLLDYSGGGWLIANRSAAGQIFVCTDTFGDVVPIAVSGVTYPLYGLTEAGGKLYATSDAQTGQSYFLYEITVGFAPPPATAMQHWNVGLGAPGA